MARDMKPKPDNDLTPRYLHGEHRIIRGVITAFFIYLLIECAAILPVLIARYGWQ